MPLILAIEPDRRQASRITALVREELHVELVVADCAERALDAIAKRIPDLLLTPQLLSPKDEAALDERLRQLDAAGSHVQTLMIPMLAASQRKSGRKDGLLGKLRRAKEEPETAGGCDPAEFAAQIKEYLSRAAEDREARASAVEDERVRASYAATPTPEATTSVTSPEEFSETFAAPPEEVAPPAVDEPLPQQALAAHGHSVEDMNADEPFPAPAEDFDPMATDPYVATISDVYVTAASDTFGTAAPTDSYAATFGSYVAPFATDADVTQPIGTFDADVVPESVVVYATASSVDEFVVEPIVESVAGPAVELLPALTEAALLAAPPNQAMTIGSLAEAPNEGTHPFSEFVEFDDLGLMDMPTVALGEFADEVFASSNIVEDEMHGASEGAAMLDALEILDGPEISPTFDPPPDSLAARHRRPQHAAASQKSTESEPEPSFDDFDFDADLWMPLPMAAARRWPAMEGPSVKAALVPSFDAPPDEAVEYAPAVKKPVKRGKPLQDEWGFFDPVQCGFAALLAKLDEVTDKDDAAGEPSTAG